MKTFALACIIAYASGLKLQTDSQQDGNTGSTPIPNCTKDTKVKFWGYDSTTGAGVEKEGKLSNAFLDICTKMDTNGDGFVSFKDFDSYMAKPLGTAQTMMYCDDPQWCSLEQNADDYDFIRIDLVNYLSGYVQYVYKDPNDDSGAEFKAAAEKFVEALTDGQQKTLESVGLSWDQNEDRLQPNPYDWAPGFLFKEVVEVPQPITNCNADTQFSIQGYDNVVREVKFSDKFLELCGQMDSDNDNFVSYRDFDRFMARNLDKDHTFKYEERVSNQQNLGFDTPLLDDNYDFIKDGSQIQSELYFYAPHAYTDSPYAMDNKAAFEDFVKALGFSSLSEAGLTWDEKKFWVKENLGQWVDNFLFKDASTN